MTPAVSFIVPAYNHAEYIGETIRSILDQTFTDFELIVIDDCSPDATYEIAASFTDPRMRAVRNETNLGGCDSFNKAFAMSRGRYIVNLDSDDWIAPRKTELQFARMEEDPRIAILGTWLDVVDAKGARHPDASMIEAAVNQIQDLNTLDIWCVKNWLGRSSTMIRRDFHETHGLYEPGMARAPDWDLWMRALLAGSRIEVLPEKLTTYRLHSRGVTHADPQGTLIEIAYLLSKNLLPLVTQRALMPTLVNIIDWHISHPEFMRLTAAQRFKLLSLFAGMRSFSAFVPFKTWLFDDAPAPVEEAVGRTLLGICGVPSRHADRLASYVETLSRGQRDWYEPRIAHLDKLVIEQAEYAQELQRTVIHFQGAEKNIFVPRIAALEDMVRQRDEVIATLNAALESATAQGSVEVSAPQIDAVSSRTVERLEQAVDQLNGVLDNLRAVAPSPLFDAAHDPDPAPNYRPTQAPAVSPRQGWLRRAAGRMPAGMGFRPQFPLSDALRESGLFDPLWYAAQYPDVIVAGYDPMAHYLQHGHRENRSPGPGFDAMAYLSENSDVEAAGLPAIIHYLAFGRAEGRRAPSGRTHGDHRA